MIDDDLLRGAAEIARFWRRSPRAAYHILEAGKLPGAFKVAGIWYLRKSTAIKMIEALERGELPEPVAAAAPEPTPIKRKPGRPAKVRPEVAA